MVDPPFWHPRLTGERTYPSEETLERMVTSVTSGAESYTPTLTATSTSPTLGSGSVQSGWWYRVGAAVFGAANIRFGTSGVSAGSGTYEVSLPLPPDTSLQILSGIIGLGTTIGSGILRDNSAGTSGSRVGEVWLTSSASGAMRIGIDGDAAGDAAPWTWAASDAIAIQFFYLAAA